MKPQKIANNPIKISILALTLAIAIFSLAGCRGSTAASTQRYSKTALLLDTVVTLTYYDEADADAVEAALELCRDYELVFSRTDAGSELYRLNAAGGLEVSDDLRTLLQTALDYCALTDGAFDITMGGVSALYGFSSEQPAAPDDAVLQEALCHVGYEKLQLDGSTVTLGDPAAVIDLGAVAKGYIADRMRDFLLAQGVEHAIVDLGGNVLCLGSKPDGSDYKVAIRDPQGDAETPIVTVAVHDGCVVTSGVYERSFVQDGVTYHHILDRTTGRSVQNGLLSVSILGEEAVQCDALSTVCFVLGLEKGLALIDGLDGYEALFITEDMVLHKSGGFDAFLIS